MHNADEETSHKQMLRQIEELRSRLTAEKQRCRELSRELLRLKSRAPFGATERKAAGEALQRTIIENLPIGLGVSDPDGRILYMNLIGKHLHGFQSETEMLSRLDQYESAFELHYLDGRLMPLEEWPIYRALRGEFVSNYMLRLRNMRTGSERILSYSAAPMRNGNGDLLLIVFVMKDLTAQKQAEEALRQSEERLRLFVEHAPAALAMFDRQMRYIKASRRWMHDYGLEGRDLRGVSHYEVFPEIPDRWREAHRRALSGEVLRAEEDSFPRADGSVQWLRWELHPWRDAGGEVAGILVFTEDITKLKHAEAEVEKEKALLQAILSQMPAGVAIAEVPSGTILMANDQLGKIMGTADCMGALHRFADGFQVFHPDGAPCMPQKLPLVRSVGSGETVTEEEIRIQRENGSHRLLSISSAPVYDSNGNRIAGVALAHDITEQRNAEEQLRQAQKMEAIGRLAGGVAHEFNNMLNVIIGYADLLSSLMGENNSLSRYVAEIREAAMRSSEMTKQLLAYSRKQAVEPKIIDLNKVIGSQQRLLGRLIPEIVEIRFMPGRDIWPVRIDPAQVDQILANLAVNARDAIPGAGQVTIATENVRIGPSEATPDRPPGDYVRLMFSDTGTGMEKDLLERIFEPYFTTKEVGKGTGLGLATVYGIVRQNNGAISVDSTPGKGTTFFLYFPKSDAEADAGTDTRAEGAAGGSETVLVVEDERQVLHLAEIMLKRAGYRVLKTQSPRDAIEIARREGGKIDLLLADIIMPEMNGMVLQAQIARLAPGIRTLFMSGYTDEVIGREPLPDKADLIRKPFTLESLTGKVREVLDRKAVSEE